VRAAARIESQCIEHALLRRYANRCTVEEDTIVCLVALELLQLTLIAAPLVGDHLATFKAAHGNDHLSSYFLIGAAGQF
jgi:hypothetical protein